MPVVGLLILVAIFLIVPGISAWVLSKRAYALYRKRKSKWAIPVGALAFVLSYFGTLVTITLALAMINPFPSHVRPAKSAVDTKPIHVSTR